MYADIFKLSWIYSGGLHPQIFAADGDRRVTVMYLNAPDALTKSVGQHICELHNDSLPKVVVER